MLEPRGSLRSTVCLRADDELRRTDDPITLPLLPILPSLEYEQESVGGSASSGRQQFLYLAVSSILVVVSGIGIVVSAKLQSISLFNYPNFTNVFCNLLYIPVCFAYIVPATSTEDTRNSLKRLWKWFLFIGALDCIATTIWTFSSMYLSGPQLILLPQFAVPLSLVACYISTRVAISNYELLGSLTVLIGILIVLEPILSYRNVPDFKCEAVNLLNDCTACQEYASKDSCLQLSVGDNHSSVCKWVRFEESTQTTEYLEYVWSLVLLFSALPVAVSAIYKQRLLREYNVMVVSGWVALFQGIFSILLVYPMNWITEIHFTAETFWAGLSCYIGTNVLDKGCHPDLHCEAAAIHLYSTVFCHVVYTISVLFVLKFSKNPVWLFLSLTIMVPLGNLIFALPILPAAIRGTNQSTDYAGLFVILAGLILYRFTGPAKKDEHHPLYDPTLESNDRGQASLVDLDKEEEDLFIPDDEHSFLRSASLLYPGVKEQTSYTLMRDSVLTGDV